MRTPVVVVNFKAYPEALGRRGLELSKAAEAVTEETGASVAVAPALTDLAAIAQAVRVPVLAQHVDAVPTGSRTGWIPPEAALAAGAVGTILNHSERRLKRADLKVTISRCRDLGLEVVACANTPAQSEAIARLRPEFVAIEPPELIGGDVSVTTAKPEVVSRAVERIHAVDRHIRVLCGAGVKTSRDVKKAIDLGAEGVLLASGVVLAKDPKKVLLDLARAL